MSGSGPSPSFYLIDFGIATLWCNKDPRCPPEYVDDYQGTALFASSTAHDQFSTSRRDDLESLSYTLAYLLRGGTLPWSEAAGS